jgi:hypothetical protein
MVREILTAETAQAAASITINSPQLGRLIETALLDAGVDAVRTRTVLNTLAERKIIPAAVDGSHE